MIRMMLVVLVGLCPLAAGAVGDELAEPVRIEAAGQPIDTEIGHAAPMVCDFDGNGTQDLLVGQFGDGALWVYLNEGSNAEPSLAAGIKFKEGKEDGTVPYG